MKTLLGTLLICALITWTNVPAQALFFESNATNIYYADTPSVSLSATADFTVVDSKLRIVLTNTGDPAMNNPDVLMGLFFTVDPSINPFIGPGSSATASQLVNAPDGAAVSGTNVNQYWAYADALTPLAYGKFNAGIAAVGLDYFGGLTVTPTQGQPDGLDYGIVNGFADGNHINTNKNPYIDNSLTFLLDLPTGFDILSITDVGFQYGTSMGMSPPVPEPSTMILLGAGLFGLAIYGKRRINKE